jgi:hypothetical protein
LSSPKLPMLLIMDEPAGATVPLVAGASLQRLQEALQKPLSLIQLDSHSFTAHSAQVVGRSSGLMSVHGGVAGVIGAVPDIAGARTDGAPLAVEGDALLIAGAATTAGALLIAGATETTGAAALVVRAGALVALWDADGTTTCCSLVASSSGCFDAHAKLRPINAGADRKRSII